jgi:predicted exporter
MTRVRVVSVAVWLALVALSVVIVARARYSADLSAFLPRSPSATQQLLVQQLQDGLASRLILIGIEGADAPTRAQVSRALAANLRTRPEFVSLSNGEAASQDKDREFVYRHRYALSAAVTPERFSIDGLRAAIADNVELMASAAGLSAKSLFVGDPTGETLQVIDQFEGSAQPHHEAGVWSSADGARALLIAQTQAAGSDTDAQAKAIDLIRAAYAAVLPAPAVAPGVAPLQLLLSGPAVFSVDARATIKHEALRLSLLSTTLIVSLLLVVYRSLPMLLIGLLPVASGALAGIVAVALGFGVVHGITLGFGVTLIGESVDYSIYLFVQSRHGGAASADAAASDAAARRSLWRTIGLGVLTSICGFASLLPSSFPGLAQLGLFSISGLIAAAAVTRFVLPQLPVPLRVADLAPVGAAAARLIARARLPLGVAAGLALACVLLLYHDRDRLWNRDLSALSPVSAPAQALDASMRADLGAPDIGSLVVVNADSEQAALRLSEAVAARLDTLVDNRVIGGYDSAARFLPSQQTQAARLASLPAEQPLRARLSAATASLNLQPDALQPFVQQVAAARSATPMTRDDLSGTSFALGADALLWHHDRAWHALLPLRANAGEIDIERVRSAVAAVAPGQVLVMNIKHELDALYGSYLAEAVHLSLAGLGAIVLLLLIALRGVARAARVIAPLLLAVLVVSAGFALAGTRLTILHLIGMLLIVAVGSNYALFFDRRAADSDRSALPLTLASLLIANACTVIGFGVLAFARVPVLSALGATVAPGTLLALLFAALLAPRRLLAGD